VLYCAVRCGASQESCALLSHHCLVLCCAVLCCAVLCHDVVQKKSRKGEGKKSHKSSKSAAAASGGPQQQQQLALTNGSQKQLAAAPASGSSAVKANEDAAVPSGKKKKSGRAVLCGRGGGYRLDISSHNSSGIAYQDRRRRPETVAAHKREPHQQPRLLPNCTSKHPVLGGCRSRVLVACLRRTVAEHNQQPPSKQKRSYMSVRALIGL
jgi:hypothetical protein